MTVTILAVLFILVVLAIALGGFKLIIKQGKSPQEMNKEPCSLCRQSFLKSQLVERQVGDSRLYYFCASCILELHQRLTKLN